MIFLRVGPADHEATCELCGAAIETIESRVVEAAREHMVEHHGWARCRARAVDSRKFEFSAYQLERFAASACVKHEGHLGSHEADEPFYFTW